MPDSLLHRSAASNESSRNSMVLLMNLFRIYAADETEQANLTAAAEIKTAFKADAAAIFYINGRKEYHVCLAGLPMPILLLEQRWRACVEAHTAEDGVTRFGPWALPGIDRPLASWISARLYHMDDEGGYIFLGKDDGSWSDAHGNAMNLLKEALAQIFKVRHERGIADHRRTEAEKRLAASEARLRALFDGLRDMVYTVDSADVITDVSLSACTLLGYASKREIIGRPFSDFVATPEDRLLFLDKIKQDGFIDDYEIVLKKKSGERIFCLETAHRTQSKADGSLEIQGIVKDISERVKNEQELWKMNLELADANMKLQKTQQLMVQHEKMASIGQLAAGVAHEINNPLGFLISNQSTLEKYARRIHDAIIQIKANSAMPPAVSEDLQKIEKMFEQTFEIFTESSEGFERIKKIVSNLKSFSRIDQSSSLQDFDVNAGIESTLVVAWNEIKYVADVQKKLEPVPTIRCNGNEINQVFLNILVNAAQAMTEQKRSEKGTIELRTSQQGKNVVVSISDDGPGIPEKIQNRIFDPFFTTKEPGKGTGLGLSISYDIIVNKHGGALWIESKPGAGTTFFISLPIAGPGSHPE